MASKNKVTLTFAGDEKDLTQAFDKVGASARDMGDKVESATDGMRRSGRSLDDVEEGFGTVDTRAMGFRDTITGLEDTMKGLRGSSMSTGERLLTLGMGVGDLASGFENLIVPMLKMKLESIKTSIVMAKGWVIQSAAAVKSIAIQIAAWIKLGIQSLISAAKVALSWLIAMGPIAIVVAAVIALVVLIIKNWDTIKRVISAGWEFVKRNAIAVWGAIKTFFINTWNALRDLFMERVERVKEIVRRGWELIKTVSTRVWNEVKAFIGRVTEAIKAQIRSQIDNIRTKVTAGWNFLKRLTTTAWNSIKEKIVGTLQDVLGQIRGKLNQAKQLFRNMVSAVRSIFAPLARAITAPIRSGLSAIKRIWNSTVGGKGINIPGFLGFGGINMRIPRLAQGGIAKARSGGHIVNIAEGGRDEAIVPLPRGMKDGLGTTITIRSGGSRMDDFLIEMLRKSIANRGGNPVTVLGGI